MKRKLLFLLVGVLILSGCGNFKNKLNQVKSTLESDYSISIKSVDKLSKSEHSKYSIEELIIGVYNVEVLDGDKFTAIEYSVCDGLDNCYKFIDNYAYVLTNKILEDYHNAKMLGNADQVLSYELLIYKNDKTVEELYAEYQEILNKVSSLKFNTYNTPVIHLACSGDESSQKFYSNYIMDGKDISKEDFSAKYKDTCTEELKTDNEEYKSDDSVKTIELKSANETLEVDNILNISFAGTKQEESNGDQQYYEYVAKIAVNGKEVDSKIYNNENDKVIWSENYASRFKVTKVNNVYILDSYVAKQNDGHYVLIISSDGKVLDSYYDVSFMLDYDSKKYVVTDCNSDGQIDEECPSKEYNILESSISS